jgi:branched-chain amino acid transport system ATP-binding protein
MEPRSDDRDRSISRPLRDQQEVMEPRPKYVERLVKLADRHTIIERGRVAWQGTSAALDADRGLWHRYLGI